MTPPSDKRNTQWDEPFDVRPDLILPDQMRSINDAVCRLGQELGGGGNIQEQRVTVNRLIDKPAEVYNDGKVIVIPVMKEYMVLTKRLVLVEEIRLSSEEAQDAFRSSPG